MASVGENEHKTFLLFEKQLTVDLRHPEQVFGLQNQLTANYAIHKKSLVFKTN